MNGLSCRLHTSTNNEQPPTLSSLRRDLIRLADTTGQQNLLALWAGKIFSLFIYKDGPGWRDEATHINDMGWVGQQRNWDDLTGGGAIAFSLL